MFGNKSRDPHVGPYCPDCGPPAKRETKTVTYVKGCPVTGEEWTSIDHCMVFTNKYPYETKTNKCEYSLGRSPFQHSAISCIHPDRLKKKREMKDK